jgi:hypothetical protein
VNPRQRQAPSYTLKSRIEEKPDLNFVPYRELPTHIGEGPKISLSGRHRELTPDKCPGPADYSPDFAKTKVRAPVSTMHVRPQECSQAVVPGPGQYSPDYEVVAPSAPHPSMHVRPRDPTPDTAPGYRALPSTLHGPYFTIKGRENLDLAPY